MHEHMATTPPTSTAIVHRPLFSWIFQGNLKLQATLVLIIVVDVFARLVPLEMQKRVVNEAIHLRKLDLLIFYCSLYLAAVVLANLTKFMSNMVQVFISQKTTARMRQELFHHILTLPLSFFRKTQAGMVVSSLVGELTTPGNFIGQSLAVPVTNLFTLFAFTIYLVWLNPLLAGVSLSIYPAVLFLIPKLQRRVNRFNKQRVNITRKVSDRISESITGIHEIKGHGAHRVEGAKYDRLVKKLEKVRVAWSLYRAGIKVFNNFFTGLGPFLVFILGGYLTIKGRLELGALVAFMSAQEKLYDPWKELLEFYQVYQDASVSYKRTMGYFDAQPEYPLLPEGRAPYALDGSLTVQNLSFYTENGTELIRDVSFTLNPGEHLALVGFSGSGKSTLALCIGQLQRYSGGHIRIGDREVAEMTKADMVLNVGVVPQSPFIFDGTVEENLVYAISAAASLSIGEKAPREGAPVSLDDMIQMLHRTGLFPDILRFGLNTVLDGEAYADLTSQLVRVRQRFQGEFGEQLANDLEFYREDRYLDFSSVAENIRFGAPLAADFYSDALWEAPFFRAFLNDADLTRPLLGIGAELTRQTVDILGELPPDEVFFEHSPIGPKELDTYKEVAQRLKKSRLHQLSTDDQGLLLRLGLRFIPGIHKMISLPRMLEALIIEGRALFIEKVLSDRPGSIAFYQMDHYIHTESILNNIVFGRVKSIHARARENIHQSLIQLLIEEDLMETVIKIGLQFQVGSQGDRLSGGQRQKLAIGRALLKNPKLLVMDEATAALDNKSQSRIQNLLDTRYKGNTTVVAVAHRLDTVKGFDRIGVMKSGKIVEMGTYDELMAQKGVFYELVRGKR